MLDITAPEAPVDVSCSSDGKVLWVFVDGETVLRICRIKELRITPGDSEPFVWSETDALT